MPSEIIIMIMEEIPARWSLNVFRSTYKRAGKLYTDNTKSILCAIIRRIVDPAHLSAGLLAFISRRSGLIDEPQSMHTLTSISSTPIDVVLGSVDSMECFIHVVTCLTCTDPDDLEAAFGPKQPCLDSARDEENSLCS